MFLIYSSNFAAAAPLPHKIMGALRIFRPRLDLFLCTPLQRMKLQGRQYVVRLSPYISLQL